MNVFPASYSSPECTARGTEISLVPWFRCEHSENLLVLVILCGKERHDDRTRVPDKPGSEG